MIVVINRELWDGRCRDAPLNISSQCKKVSSFSLKAVVVNEYGSNASAYDDYDRITS